MSTWTRTTPITEAEANAEPEADRLFGPSYDLRQVRLRGQLPDGIERDRFTPWKKPRIIRTQNSSQHKGVSD